MEGLMNLIYLTIVIITVILSLKTVKDSVGFFKEIWVFNFKKK